MGNPKHRAKPDLRQQISKALEHLSAADLANRSAQAITLLRNQSLWIRASSVLFYAPLPRELDIWPLLPEAIAQRKQVFLPRFDAESGAYQACQLRDLQADLQVGRFGIREPILACPPLELKKLDLLLVPGVAFDLHGRRLGRGKGYYDRLLGSVHGIICGVGFDEQVVSEVPVEPHDVYLNRILTPTRWIEL